MSESESMNTIFYLADKPECDPEYPARVATLKSNLSRLSTEQRSGRARAIAAALGVSEVQWVAASQDRIFSRPLLCQPASILTRLTALGEVLALTRNDACVHELTGNYDSFSIDQSVFLVQSATIDLRLFISKIKSVWAVSELGRFSLQFFDQSGCAIHKVYCTQLSNMTAYHELVKDFAAPILSWPTTVTPVTASLSKVVDQSEVLRQAWLSLQDTHDFFAMIQRFNVTRVAAFKAAGNDLAQAVSIETVEHVLTEVAAGSVPIMCFVANGASIQIYTGLVHTLYRRGAWYNIIDPSFNLHLNTDAIESAWIVTKPTVDGWVTSLELYDCNEQLIVQFFGARKPGQSELSEWRNVLRRYSQSSLRSYVV